jgi:hypothetical protein
MSTKALLRKLRYRDHPAASDVGSAGPKPDLVGELDPRGRVPLGGASFGTPTVKNDKWSGD